MTAQQKIGSGFGKQTTAKEVLAGIDLRGKLAIVTGGYSGIGLETTKALKEAGAEVIVPARRREVAADAVAGLATAETLDLGDLDSVRAFAEKVAGRDVHVLIDSAGIMACPETRLGPGWEAQFATNHLGHFALVNRLWPALVRGKARVVSVSSAAHHNSAMRWDDVDFRTGYDKWKAYGQSKTANALFAVALDARGKKDGVRAFSLHPGAIMTPLQRHLPREEMIAFGWVDADGNLVNKHFKNPEQGAATQVWAATSPRLADLGGLYLEDCEVAEPAPEGKMRGVKAYAVDPAEAERLWKLSAERTGVDAFATA